MKAFNCPDHGALMLDLARGRLDDVEARAADEVRESCRHCAEWWDATFSAPSVAEVDAAVAAAFADFSVPVRSRRTWIAAAAAAVLAVGVGTTSLMWRSGGPSSAQIGPGAESTVALSSWDFEDEQQTPTLVHAEIEPPSQNPDDDEGTLFVSDLESGDLGSWTLHS